MNLNVLITVYSMLTIAAAIFVTVAILVLIGWELNVLESVTISVAVGLSIDYSLHYGMAYRLSPDLDRHARVVDAIKNISSPVAMAAATTFLVGACLMPSTVLAYRQLGIFLMIVISVSWTYATFFFQSLLEEWQELRHLGVAIDVEKDAPNHQRDAHKGHQKHGEGDPPIFGHKMHKS